MCSSNDTNPSSKRSNSTSISDIVDCRPTDLRPSPGNPRKHSTKQIEKLKAAITHYGFLVAVIVDECFRIIMGHGRVLAAIALGLKTIPVRIISGLSEEQKLALMISDNKIGDLSTWDDDLLKQQIEIIVQADLDVEITGFSTAEVDLFFVEPGEKKAVNPDDLQMVDVRNEVISRPGDLWHCDKQRIFCGDARDEASYQAVMRGERAQMVIADLPYNMPSKDIGGNGKTKHPDFAMAAGEMDSPGFILFLSIVLQLACSWSRNGAIHFYFMDWRHLGELLEAALKVFGPLKQLCVWDKGTGGMGTFYRSQHELIAAFKHGDATHINNFELGQHGRYRTNVWSYPPIGRDMLALHPTVKPVSLIADAIRDCSHRKGLILDSFAGSGTILVAAERTGRYARAIEIDPHYVDIAVQRWQRVSGQQPILAATGQTWEQVRVERLASLGKEIDHGL